jgi:hypothetical protein
VVLLERHHDHLDRLAGIVDICVHLLGRIRPQPVARIRCDACAREYLLAFSCKCRYFYSVPSSGRRESLFVPSEGWTLDQVPGKRLSAVPVYILTSRRTFSAAESITFGLKATGRVIIVGEQTGGGGLFGRFIPLTEGFSMFLPVGRTYDPRTNEGWEAEGIAPDVAVPEEQAPEKALELARGRVSVVPASQTPLPSVALPAELDRVLRDYERHWQARNTEALASLFVPDGFVLNPVMHRCGVGPRLPRRIAAPTALSSCAPWTMPRRTPSAISLVPTRVPQGKPTWGKFILALRRDRAVPGGLRRTWTMGMVGVEEILVGS